ncbi:hypothetical protein EQ826_23525 [Ectopseudomonas mendocina]|nr:hypothetical protein [Pseudomonas mendocina]TRO20548.1 hypothetical protein EQ826_23525 [Pseudomonas mendocina]
MSSTIEDRVILILKEQMSPADLESLKGHEGPFSALLSLWSQPPYAGRGFWEKLSQLTGIPSARWRSAFSRKQKPTSAMIESIAHLWPKYAFWLVTGVTDAANGHVAPLTALTFPEFLHAEQPGADAYFGKAIALAKRLYEEGAVDLESDEARLAAVERTLPLAHWVGSDLVEVAYRLAASDEYQELVSAWERREDSRAEHLGRVLGTDRPWEQQLEEAKLRGAKLTPIRGVDPRTKHQSSWDLFYKPDSEDA